VKLKSRALRTNLDVCKFYFDRYLHYEEKGDKKQANLCLKRLIQLLKKEWKDIFK